MPSLAQILATVGQGRGLPQRFKPFADQAANEAFLRFAPAWDLLNAGREQSATTMRQGITQATSAAQLNAALARQGAKDFGGLPANPLPYEGAPGSSAAIAATNRGLTREGTLAMLATAANNAPIAGAQQVRQLTDVHADDLAKINSQRASLGGQVGAFVQGRLGSLIGEDRKSRAAVNAQRRQLEVQLRGQDVSAETTRRGQDVTTRGQDLSHEDRQESIAQRREAARNKNKGALPGGVKVLSPKEHGKLKDNVGSVQSVIAREDKALQRTSPNLSASQRRRVIAQDLVQGRNVQTIDQVQIPGVPKTGPLTASVALDTYFDKHVSRRNIGELHKRGFSLKQLGFPTSSRVRLPIVGSVQTGT